MSRATTRAPRALSRAISSPCSSRDQGQRPQRFTLASSTVTMTTAPGGGTAWRNWNTRSRLRVSKRSNRDGGRA